MEKTYTHKELVEIAYKWVLKNASCGVAFKEFNCVNDTGEQPDVLGFGSWGHSVLIEVKVSRSDFLADRKKKFRINPETGMGSQRYYCCPTGLIKAEELPTGWGLLYVNEKGRATKVRSLNPDNIYSKKLQCNIQAEMAVMYSALRRLQLRGRIDEIYIPLAEVKIQEYEAINNVVNNNTDDSECAEVQEGVQVQGPGERNDDLHDHNSMG